MTALPPLTPREQQVLKLVLKGHFNKVIAHQLGISCRTVEVHRAALYRKLGVRSGTALAWRVAQFGLNHLPETLCETVLHDAARLQHPGPPVH